MAQNGTYYDLATETTATSTLSGLTDVTITTPAANQALQYNGSVWVNSAVNLSELGDASISSPSDNQFLRHNGTAWVNETVTIPSVDSGAAAGQMLFWDAGNSKWTYSETSELAWDDTNKRLGIGEASPAFALDIDNATATNVKIGMSGAQVLYRPDQTNFSGSIAYGNGLTSLSFASGADGQNNTAVGINALNACTSGNTNTCVGHKAGEDITTGSGNACIGSLAGQNITLGLYNTLIGGNTSTSLTVGSNNIALGYSSLSFNVSGGQNIAIGRNTLRGASGQSHSNNVGIGYQAGIAVTTGSNNIFIGYQAGDNVTTGASNIIIGYDINAASATGNSQLSIGDVIKGDISTGNIEVTGNFKQVCNTTDVSNPPTDAELDAAYGAPATVGAGYRVLINDNGGGANFYECISDGTNWWISTFTVAS